ncbi:Pal1 cell morphology protein [Rutstroemia sp. NJR-2017a WRK4]|nr:Pal1 cell morphology protein [Rutstroemia sp. NJR-2017a WRK4]
MESASDKEWASKYILDPLNAPEPSEETGPGSHFTSSMPKSSPSKSSKSPTVTSYPTPPASASPTRSSFHPTNPYASSHRQSAFSGYSSPGSKRRSLDEPVSNGKGRQRGSSLSERYPGDMSHRPLDQLRQETKQAYRAPHLRKKHLPGADIVDSLDDTSLGGAYHHEGPYDATLLSRNTRLTTSPVAATQGTNAEALRATPKEMIKDSLEKHVPLQGTAIIPPGMPGPDGSIMNYEEGADLMREPDAPGGAYKRWDHVKYLPEDLKGKGEPSFTIEKALKDHEQNKKLMADGYEMQTPRSNNSRQRSASGSHDTLGKSTANNSMSYVDFEGGMRRSNSTGKKVGEGLKRRFGSLRRTLKG